MCIRDRFRDDTMTSVELENQAKALIAVSYTHLDVYKRQCKYSAKYVFEKYIYFLSILLLMSVSLFN